MNAVHWAPLADGSWLIYRGRRVGGLLMAEQVIDRLVPIWRRA